MKTPRRFHRGTVQVIKMQRRCWQGVVMLLAFSFTSGLLQSTFGLHERNRTVSQSIRAKERRLAALRGEFSTLQSNRLFLQSNAGVVTAARTLGYGRPGERRVMFDQPLPAGSGASAQR